MEAINKEDLVFAITKGGELILWSQELNIEHFMRLFEGINQTIELMPLPNLAMYMVADLMNRERRHEALKARADEAERMKAQHHN